MCKSGQESVAFVKYSVNNICNLFIAVVKYNLTFSDFSPSKNVTALTRVPIWKFSACVVAKKTPRSANAIVDL